MNTAIKFFNKKLVNRILQQIKRIIHHEQVGIFLETQDCYSVRILSPENLLDMQTEVGFSTLYLLRLSEDSKTN